jgi:hypothetical protein
VARGAAGVGGATWIVAGWGRFGLTGLLAALAGAHLAVVLAEVCFDAGFVARTSGTAAGASRVLAMNAVLLVAGPLGGWAAPRISALAVIELGVLVVLAGFAPDLAAPAHATPATGVGSLRGALGPALLGFLFYAVPGFGVAQYYRQIQVFGFTPAECGWLDTVNNGAGLLALPFFFALRRRISLGRALPVCVGLYACSSALYLLYDRGLVASVIEAGNGFVATFGLCAIQESAARSARAQGGAGSLALVLGASNVGMVVSEVLGARLYVAAGRPFGPLVLLHCALYVSLALTVAAIGGRWAWLRDRAV